jgi:DNA helicase-2/ATP-dependent DNA helicase PcrA
MTAIGATITKMKAIETFTEVQRGIIESVYSNNIVLSCPGSGKTSVLVARIRHLLEQGVPPSEIVAITFTNSASSVIVERLGDCRLSFVGTIHAYLFRLLRLHGREIYALPDKLTVLDDEQCSALIKDVRHDLKIKVSVTEIRNTLLDLWWGRLELDAVPTVTRPLVNEITRRMIANGFFSYDAILALGAKLVDRLSETLEPGRVLLLDEGQDCSVAVAGIIDTLPFPEKFIVASLDQAIFSFIGGDPGWCVTLANSPEYQTWVMASNFRCDAMICQFANRLMSHGLRPQEPMESVTGGTGSVEVYQDFEDDSAEYAMVAREIQLHLDAAGDEPFSCAVLCRTRQLVSAVTDALRQHGVPVKPSVGDNDAAWTQMKRFVALLANPQSDELAYWFLRVRFGSDYADRARHSAAQAFQSINDYHLQIPVGLGPGDIRGQMQFAGVRQSIDNWMRVEELIRVHLTPESTLSDLLVVMERDTPQELVTAEGVTVCTIHAAKGREFDTVFLPALDDGIYPISGEDPEESRRLLFVGLTRARCRCVLSTAQMRPPQWGNGRPVAAAPSRFIAELTA